jgi:hypothetical protein
MAKVYRLHEGQDGTGWFVSNPITAEHLKTIKTDGKDVATSIPSPFARIDLVKSAFRWVADNGIEGVTAQHKLVSDALDVAQLFFLYPKLSGKIKIVSWNPQERFEAMINEGNVNHSTFADTLRIIWNSEADRIVYNFDRVQRLYFILNNANQIIGGTSPATMFFAAPDVRLATKDLNITCGHDILFDDKYMSLNKRDKSFIKYIFTLSKQPNFASLFPDVYSYLEEIKNHIDNALRTEIAGISASSLNSYPPCPVLDNPMNPCEILGIPLKVEEVDGKRIEAESDFVISAENQVNGLKPLILPNEKFSNQWVYTTNGIFWNPNNQVENKNLNIENSVLPVLGDQYPWLSIDNFLEDSIIELPYNIDNSKFITCGAKKHLIPLTPTFFKYFKAENVSKYITLSELTAGSVETTLRIPTRKGDIIFKRLYRAQSSQIVKLEFHLAILPFVKTSKINLEYTIGIQDKRFDRNHELVVECFKGEKIIKITAPVIRRPKEGNSIISSYFKSHEFDAIRLSDSVANGFIVPRLMDGDGTSQISFAIDFGTTNTHIEYKYGHIAETAIDNTNDLPMWQSLIDKYSSDNIQIVDDNIFEREIFPYQFNPNTEYKFPFRTALTYNQNIDFNVAKVFTHTNNFFLFEKLFCPTYLKLHTKLKWSNYSSDDDKFLVNSYIKGLLYLVLYKSLMLKCDPKKTRITWFYPVSMDSFEKGIFIESWEKSYKEVFQMDNTNNINVIPESIAPYLKYRGEYPGMSLSIDIGGGSTDIAVFEKEKEIPEFISSIKFAGNAIFGDGFPSSAFSNSSDNNGFVRTFKDDALKSLSKNSNKLEILSDILNKRKDSADFSSFLFSLENEKDINFNYTEKLRSNRILKLPILLFYGSVVYYSANLLKKTNYKKLPNNLLFSGTAAKTLKIIDANKNFSNVTKFFTYILNSVLEINANGLKIALAENPKEITCKGVLKAGISSNITECPILFWLGGNSDSIWGKAINDKDDISEIPYYSDVNDKNKTQIEDSLNHFFGLMDSYIDGISIDGEFGIDELVYKRFKEMRSINIKDYIEQGIKAFYKKPEKHIEESLFFYPLIGILNKLSSELSNNENV